MTEVVVQPTVITVVPDASVIGAGSRVAVTLGQVAVIGVAQGVPGPAGAAGPAGPAGPTGPQGPPGPAGDLHEVFTQALPAAVWHVTHSLLKRPSVTVIDSSGRMVLGQVDYLSDSALDVTFSAAFAGAALLN